MNLIELMQYCTVFCYGIVIHISIKHWFKISYYDVKSIQFHKKFICHHFLKMRVFTIHLQYIWYPPNDSDSSIILGKNLRLYLQWMSDKTVWENVAPTNFIYLCVCLCVCLCECSAFTAYISVTLGQDLMKLGWNFGTLVWLIVSDFTKIG